MALIKTMTVADTTQQHEYSKMNSILIKIIARRTNLPACSN